MSKTVWCGVLALALVALVAGCGGDSEPELTPAEQAFCDQFEAVQDDFADEEAAELYSPEALEQLETYRAALDAVEATPEIEEDWAGQLAALDETITIYGEVVDAGITVDTPGDDPELEALAERFDAVPSAPGESVADYLDDRCGISSD